MGGLTRMAKRAAARLGVHVSRSGAINRFQAMEDCFSRMRDAGYVPSVVIDGGANMGQFFGLIRPIFPSASYHLIEPQTECAETLAELAERYPKLEIHRVAVTEPGVDALFMEGSGSTGAWVDLHVGPGRREISATTLDALFVNRVHKDHRALLKLDVESHELSALRGARAVLDAVEAVLLEVAFYDFGNRGRPLFRDILTFMSDAGFEIYDVASLSGRRRDQRLRMGDVLFIRRGSPLAIDSRD